MEYSKRYVILFQSKLPRNDTTLSNETSSDETPQTSSAAHTPRGMSDDEYLDTYRSSSPFALERYG